MPVPAGALGPVVESRRYEFRSVIDLSPKRCAALRVTVSTTVTTCSPPMPWSTQIASIRACEHRLGSAPTACVPRQAGNVQSQCSKIRFALAPPAVGWAHCRAMPPRPSPQQRQSFQSVGDRRACDHAPTFTMPEDVHSLVAAGHHCRSNLFEPMDDQRLGPAKCRIVIHRARNHHGHARLGLACSIPGLQVAPFASARGVGRPRLRSPRSRSSSKFHRAAP